MDKVNSASHSDIYK